MKWLIILCNLIIFSFGVLRAETEAHDDKCANQHENEMARAMNCKHAIYEKNDDFNEVETTITEYSGDEASIRTLAAKYCPLSEQLLQCSVLSGDIDEECLPDFFREYNKLDYDIPNAVLSYVCANNATTLLRVLESNGFATIAKNREAMECFKLMDRDKKLVEDTTQGPNIIEMCNGFDRVRECYTNLVKDHDNKNLVPIANELHLLIRQTVKCPTVSEN